MNSNPCTTRGKIVHAWTGTVPLEGGDMLCDCGSVHYHQRDVVACEHEVKRYWGNQIRNLPFFDQIKFVSVRDYAALESSLAAARKVIEAADGLMEQANAVQSVLSQNSETTLAGCLVTVIRRYDLARREWEGK